MSASSPITPVRASKPAPNWRGVIDHYRDRLNITKSVPPVTLLEGNTALLPAPRLAQALSNGKGDFELFIKYEAGNPTGSFKVTVDRDHLCAVTECASQLPSGNFAIRH